MAAKAKVNLKIDEVLEEQDVFRLAIRGYVAVESFIDETIAEAFGGSTPVVLRRLPVRARLALLGALTPIPERFTAAIAALAELRNDFAHGRLDELSFERAQAVAELFRSAFPDQLSGRFDKTDPRDLLAACIQSAHLGVQVAGDLAREQNVKERKAIALQEEVKRLVAESEA